MVRRRIVAYLTVPSPYSLGIRIASIGIKVRTTSRPLLQGSTLLKSRAVGACRVQWFLVTIFSGYEFLKLDVVHRRHIFGS